MDRRRQLEEAGRWLRTAREQHGSNVRRFAAELDVTTQAVYNWESGKNAVDDDRANRIAKVLSMDIIEVRRNLGLWTPPAGDDELTEPEDDPELLRLIRQAERERAAGDPTLYKMLLRLQGMTEPPREAGSVDDETPGGTQQVS